MREQSFNHFGVMGVRIAEADDEGRGGAWKAEMVSLASKALIPTCPKTSAS
jgi:hypothetical protein